MQRGLVPGAGSQATPSGWPGSGTAWQCQDTGPRSRQVTWHGDWHQGHTVMRHPPCHGSVPGYLLLKRHKLNPMQAALHWRETILLSIKAWMYLSLEHFGSVQNCASIVEHLSNASIYVSVSMRHEAAQAGLAWGQLQLWILSQARVTLSPHYSLTWPHHYHSNTVNHYYDSDALSSLSFIIFAHHKKSCFSVFLARRSLKTPPTQKVHLLKLKVVMIIERTHQKILLFPLVSLAIKKCLDLSCKC